MITKIKREYKEQYLIERSLGLERNIIHSQHLIDGLQKDIKKHLTIKTDLNKSLMNSVVVTIREIKEEIYFLNKITGNDYISEMPIDLEGLVKDIEFLEKAKRKEHAMLLENLNQSTVKIISDLKKLEEKVLSYII